MCILVHKVCLSACRVQDMELIEILYLQDIDLGIGREAFDDLCHTDSASVNATVQKKDHELKQV